MYILDPSATRKTQVSIWVTWLAKLMSGDNQCDWSAWFQAQYYFDKIESDFNSAKWTAEHNELLKYRVAILESEGYTVFIEDENKFDILGKRSNAKVSGKPDIVAIKNGQAIVEDCKTGKVRNADFMQVLIYMFLLSRPGAPTHCKNLLFNGRLVYNDSVMDVEAVHIDDDFKNRFKEAVARISASEPARKVPSARECKYCKIATKYCPERIDEENSITGEDDLF